MDITNLKTSKHVLSSKLMFLILVLLITSLATPFFEEVLPQTATATTGLPPETQPGKIVFSSSRDNDSQSSIYVMNSDGTNQTRLSTLPGLNQHPSWSPDGSKIAFATNGGKGESDIFIMNADGTEAARLTRDFEDDIYPTWSPDGSKIAFVSSREGNYKVFVMNADGTEQTKLTDSTGDDSHPSWSPDGSKIAYASVVGVDTEILVINVDHSGLVQLTNDGINDYSPAWSPDGSKIAVASSNALESQIRVISSTTGITIDTLIVSDGKDTNKEPDWSPDGNKIAFSRDVGGNRDIYVMNLLTGRPGNQLTTVQGADTSPSYVPDDSSQQQDTKDDGYRVVFSTRVGFSSQDIYMMNSDGSGQTRVTNSSFDDVEPSLSPDGTKIVFAGGSHTNYEIYVVNVDGTGQTKLTDSTGSSENPAWSPDGSKIAYACNNASRAQYDIFVMNADGTGQTKLTSNADHDYSPSWSPDGKRIAFQSVSNLDRLVYEIFTINIDGSDQKQLTSNGANNIMPDWSPDGNKIAIATGGGSPLHLAVISPLDGSTITNFDNFTVFDSNPSWSPDGSRLAFEGHPAFSDSKIFIVTTFDIQVVSQLTLGRDDSTSPDFGLAPARTGQDDTTPPDVTITPDREPDSDDYYNHSVVFTAKGEDGIANGDNVTCDAPINYSAPDGKAIQLSMDCNDLAGNVATANVQFNFDSTAPTITINSLKKSGSSQDTLVLSGTSSDATSGVRQVDVKFDSASFKPAAGTTSWSFSVSELVPGDHTLAIKATDEAGNSKQVTGRFTLPEQTQDEPGAEIETEVVEENVQDEDRNDDVSNDDSSSKSIRSVTVDGETYSASSISESSRLTSLEIDPGISVGAMFDKPGPVELTLPKSLIDDIIAVKSNGQSLEFDVVAVTNSETTISFNIPSSGTSENRIEITATRIVPEYPGIVVLAILTMIIGAAAIGRRIIRLD